MAPTLCAATGVVPAHTRQVSCSQRIPLGAALCPAAAVAHNQALFERCAPLACTRVHKQQQAKPVFKANKARAPRALHGMPRASDCTRWQTCLHCSIFARSLPCTHCLALHLRYSHMCCHCKSAQHRSQSWSSRRRHWLRQPRQPGISLLWNSSSSLRTITVATRVMK